MAIPSIGRVDLLADCLTAISAGTVEPEELLVVDQSGDPRLLERVEEQMANPLPDYVRLIPNRRAGIAANLNVALESATSELLLVTHDDCVVDPEWVSIHRLIDFEVGPGLVTGTVRAPDGVDPRSVPSVTTKTDPVDFSGQRTHGMLYPANMAVDRNLACSIGGFDERKGFWTAAEDLDFEFRWFQSGLPFRYRPEPIVTHVDWREASELTALYRRYSRCAGRYYAKHLVRGELSMLKMAWNDVKGGVRAWVDHRGTGEPRWTNERLQAPFGVPVGLAEGVVESLLINVRGRPESAISGTTTPGSSS